MDKRWMPKPGRFGTSVNGVDWSGFGLTAPITASATTELWLPIPVGKLIIARIYYTYSTAAAGGGAITAQFFKRPASTTSASDVALTGTIDLTAAVVQA